STDGFAQGLAAALRLALGSTHASVKRAASWTGAHERTVKNWFAGRCGPNGAHLVGLLRNSDEVLDAILLMAERRELAGTRNFLDIRAKLVEMIAIIDTFNKERGSRV
ncbi:MAG TPA: hypothetical protein VG758_10150, partial [Hyphomicrobiaceae bacterium]|nr:hypothetical protein [Hyphomicrobiaceae bacterium]